jgi:hypothetical protein
MTIDTAEIEPTTVMTLAVKMTTAVGFAQKLVDKLVQWLQSFVWLHLDALLLRWMITGIRFFLISAANSLSSKSSWSRSIRRGSWESNATISCASESISVFSSARLVSLGLLSVIVRPLNTSSIAIPQMRKHFNLAIYHTIQNFVIVFFWILLKKFTGPIN